MKSFSARNLGFPLLAFLLLSMTVPAQDIPLSNWTIPPYHAESASGGLSTMAEVTPGIAFIGVSPCRLVDTRQAGFPAGYGMPALTGGVPRNFDLNNDPLCTGFPADGLVQAYSLNITVTNTQGPGFILIYPQGGAQPPVSTLNYVAGQTVANAAIVPAGTAGGVTVIAGVSWTDLIIDINGYFTIENGVGGNAFHWQSDNSGTFGAAIIVNTNATTNDTLGLVVRANSTGNGTSAVFGTSFGATGHSFGVKGVTNSTSDDAAGVKGVDGASGDPLGDTLDCSFCFEAGVRGVSNDNHGVLGITRFWSGVTGLNLASTGTTVDTAGRLGYATYGVFSNGDYGGTAGKFFVEPHPTDPSLVIKYVTLEGPEAGTYFRGRGRFDRGTAVIEVPEDFRMVTDSEGLSIQVTPIGEMATVAVASIGLDRIVVRGSRNVEFFYTVNGIRRALKDHRPIQQSVGEYMPAKPDAKLSDQGWLREEQRRVLIQNGTYKPDGTINLETAHRLGWDRAWAERERPRPVSPPE